ncbi:UNVERIFIED_CONTAM: hypothetical protein K2H54_030072 [Gekko kuhli]
MYSEVNPAVVYGFAPKTHWEGRDPAKISALAAGLRGDGEEEIKGCFFDSERQGTGACWAGGNLPSG